MNNRSTILVVAEFSDSGNNAAWRATVLAAEHKTRLKLLHVVPGAANDTRLQEARRQLEQLASQLEAKAGVHVDGQVTQGDLLREATRFAGQADLLVLGSRRRNALREWLMGTAVERLIRLARIPVLVVKRPVDHAYRRVLVPVALSSHQDDAAIAAALDFSPEAQVEIFHAMDKGHAISLRAGEVPELLRTRLRNRAEDDARAGIGELIRRAGRSPRRVAAALGFGDAASLALQREAAMAAQLIVIGKRHESLLADFLLGSVTRRLLAESDADVLVVPPPQPGQRPRQVPGAARLLLRRNQ